MVGKVINSGLLFNPYGVGQLPFDAETRSREKGKPTGSLAAQMIFAENPKSEKSALNPDWVEWLMGFPHKWTDVQSGEKSLTKSRA